MKKYLIICILLFFVSNSIHSIRIGEWQAHLAYNDATQTIVAGNIVYVLSSGSIFTYDIEDTSVYTYDKVNTLNDNEVKQIAYNKANKTLLIVYQNSNIDLLINDREAYNIPDFMNKPMTEDKTLNNIFLIDDYAYLSTNFGILILNLKKKEITNTYILNKKVNNCVVLDNIIYAATDEGIYTGDQRENLLDKENWHRFNTMKLNNILLFNKDIIGNMLNDGIYKFDPDTKTSVRVMEGNFTFSNVTENKLIISNTASVVIFNSLDNYTRTNQENSFAYIAYNKSKDNYWMGCGKDGLIGYKYNKDNNSFEIIVSSIIPNSPVRNLFYYLTFTNNRLLVAGGYLNFWGIVNPGTVMMYDEENGTWINFEDGESIVQQTGFRYVRSTSIIEDPLDPEHHFVAAAGGGIYEFKKFKFVKLYSINNSTLQSALPNDPSKENYVWTDGLQYDDDHNLWMLNSNVFNVINVMKNDGKWVSFNHPEISQGNRIEAVDKLFIDKRKWVWVTTRQKKGGLFCLNTNNTLEDTKDDQTKYISSFINQDGKTISISEVHCIIEDKNGVLWVGSDRGPLLINNPTKIFDDDFYFTQVKIPRNDGTNNADLLLENESVKTICADGANRKWLGTENSGVYLLSEDGLETIHHFTTDNSPLLSNAIQSIAINPHNGLVYIGTDKGLVIYKSDATEAGDSFSDDAHAYPNPVHPDYDGVITVTGLVRDSDVKITDSNGNLIYTGTSVGGQFTWNGKNRNGKRVASGIYFVLATNSEGKEGIATKILVIK